MQLTILGSGTSHGVPVIACQCRVCKSTDEHDKRNRCSAYVTTKNGTAILIDCGPEFRIQALKHDIRKIDAVLLTHSHADHLHGLDDLRVFSSEMLSRPKSDSALAQYYAPPIPIYSNASAIRDIKNRFDYCFVPVKQGGGRAKIELKEVNQQFVYKDLTVTPIPMMHGHLETVGWLLTETTESGERVSIAYLTDCSYISEESIQLIKDNCGTLEHLVIDALRFEPHGTHYNFIQAMEVAEKIGAEQNWFTHLTHHASHTEYEQYIKNHLQNFPALSPKTSPAFDGLIINTTK